MDTAFLHVIAIAMWSSRAEIGAHCKCKIAIVCYDVQKIGNMWMI